MNIFEKFKKSAKEFANVRSVVTMAMLLALRVVLSVFVSIRIGESLKISTAFLATAVMGVSFGPTAGFIFGAAGDIIQWALNPTGPLIIGLTVNSALAGLIYGMAFYGSLPRFAMKEKESKLPRWCAVCSIIVSSILLLVGFAVLLMAYNDRKNTTYPSWLITGAIVFVVIAAIIFTVMLITASVDRIYVLKVVVATVLVNVGINAFLGTYFLANTYGWDYWVYFVPRLIKNLLLIPIESVCMYYVLSALSKNRYLHDMILK